MYDITIKDIKEDDLSSLHREICEVIGIDKMLELCKMYGGTSLYVPSYKEFTKYTRYRLALEDYKKSCLSPEKIALKYGLSSKTIYNILNKKYTLYNKR